MAWRGGGDEMSESQEGTIRCADCRFCRQFKEVNGATGRYVLKVRCARGGWQVGRKLGHTDWHRLMTRRVRKCPDYDSMSDNERDRARYLCDLAATLPLERIVYEADGEPADIFEIHGIDLSTE